MSSSIQQCLIAANDPDRPSVENQSLQQYDNYGMYTLVCTDRVLSTTKTEYFASNSFGVKTTFNPVTHTASLQPINPPLVTNKSDTTLKNNWVAIQSFSPVGIKVNFLEYVIEYNGQ